MPPMLTAHRAGLVTVLLLGAGCPESDDIYLIDDIGLTRFTDAVIPGDAPPPEDGQVAVDHGGPIPDNGPDGIPPAGCTNDGHCAGVIAGLKPCEQAVCDVESGDCVAEDQDDGAVCDDDDACSETECKAGACVVVSEVVCDDNNQCTADDCKSDTGCIHLNTNLPCDDGDICTDGDTCKDGACVAGNQVVCELGAETNPAPSCQAILTAEATSKSGTYYLKTPTGHSQVYCDMTISGGGWLRVAYVGGEIKVCSFDPGFGAAKELLGVPAKTTALPAQVVTSFGFVMEELLVVLDQGSVVFTSGHAQWSWSSVSDGTVNASNVVDYAVKAAIDGAPPAALANVAGSELLLGGQIGGKSVLLLGHGAKGTGEFKQDASCDGYPEGLYVGPPFAATGWKKPGYIYIR